MNHEPIELLRRTEQFHHYLRLMVHRTKFVVQGDCFIVFDERNPESRGQGRLSSLASVPGIELLQPDDPVFRGRTHGDGEESSQTNWAGIDNASRYVQFAFQEDMFYMELPNNSLFPSEAQRLFSERNGFFFAKDRPEATPTKKSDVRTWNMVQKVYAYGEEALAANDMAFVVFQVWRLLPYTALYVRAAAFKKDFSFESGHALG